MGILIVLMARTVPHMTPVVESVLFVDVKEMISYVNDQMFVEKQMKLFI